MVNITHILEGLSGDQPDTSCRAIQRRDAIRVIFNSGCLSGSTSLSIVGSKLIST